MPVVVLGVDVVVVHGVARVRVGGERDYRPIISNVQVCYHCAVLNHRFGLAFGRRPIG